MFLSLRIHLYLSTRKFQQIQNIEVKSEVSSNIRHYTQLFLVTHLQSPSLPLTPIFLIHTLPSPSASLSSSSQFSHLRLPLLCSANFHSPLLKGEETPSRPLSPPTLTTHWQVVELRPRSASSSLCCSCSCCSSCCCCSSSAPAFPAPLAPAASTRLRPRPLTFIFT